MAPKIPRPPHFEKFDRGMREATSSIPPAIKRHHTDRDIEVNEALMAMAAAFNLAQRNNGERFDSLDTSVRSGREQVAALHGQAIKTHEYVTRHPWLRSPVSRLVATFLGAAVGAYAASKGLMP